MFLYFLFFKLKLSSCIDQFRPKEGVDAKTTWIRLSTLNLLPNTGRVIQAKHFSGFLIYSFSLVRLYFKAGPSMDYNTVNIWPITVHDF